MKVYISGKISETNIKDTRDDFEIVEMKLRDAGHEVVNPFKIKHSEKNTWEDYMRADIVELMKCDAIYLIKGWQYSKGAKIEVQLANDLNFHFLNFK